MSLDVPERQILVYYPNDAVPWHHRLLFFRVAGSTWVWSTPDFSIQVDSLQDRRIRALPRNSPLPDLGERVYVFDPIDDAQLLALRTEARAMAEVMGADLSGTAQPALGVPEALWLYSDTGEDTFNTEVAGTDISRPTTVVRGRWALVHTGEDDDGEQIFSVAERVKEKDRRQWLEHKRSGSGRDPRLSTPRTSAAGEPVVDLAAAVVALKPTKMPGWVFDGPNAAPDFLQGVLSAGLTLLTFQAYWEKKSGVNPASGAAMEHGVLLMILHLLVNFDQLDVSNVAGAEQLVRRLLMIQRAVRKNPKAPNWSGLNYYLTNKLDESGGVVVAAFDKHVAALKHSEAFILKQERLWLEEQDDEVLDKNAACSGPREPRRRGGKNRDAAPKAPPANP